jgi:hypothetical protein
MKHLYPIILLLFTTLLFAQDRVLVHPQDSTKESFELYPNPVFDDVVYVKTKKQQPKTIQVYDVFGKLVLRDRIMGKALDISDLVPGVYLLQVTENQKSMTRKLVVK